MQSLKQLDQTSKRKKWPEPFLDLRGKLVRKENHREIGGGYDNGFGRCVFEVDIYQWEWHHEEVEKRSGNARW